MLEDGLSLRKSLFHSGCSRKIYYHKVIPRMISLDPAVGEKVKELGAWLPCSVEISKFQSTERESGESITRSTG